MAGGEKHENEEKLRNVGGMNEDEMKVYVSCNA